ncbi:hybrid sensor histidine kinase/response regulator [Bacteroidia bacterium]|nr:hybrid sensor histidine kinase/response regulator [Bacteroidia bacterium]
MKSYVSDYIVLVVDDVSTNIMLVNVILKNEGYTILTADCGTKALEMARTSHPNIILLNTQLPDLDGFEVLRQLKSSPETNHINVIMMSSLDDIVTIIKGYHLGVNEYITKPFQKDELIKRIAHYFQQYALERMRQELESNIELHNMLYAIISHDLRQPVGLQKIMNNSVLQMVKKETVGEPVYEMLLTMNKISEEAFQILDNLSKLAKVNRNQIQPYKQRTDIVSLVEGLIAVYEPIALLKRITISLQSDVIPQGMIDIDMIKTVIRNLLSNAINYSYEGETVLITLNMKDENLCFKIKDKGIGIKDEDKELLFSKPFYMNLGNKVHQASGFGVYIVKSFIELHGGTIGYESEVGKGSTFFFTLNLEENQ